MPDKYTFGNSWREGNQGERKDQVLGLLIPRIGWLGTSSCPHCLPILIPQMGLFISYDNATKQLDTVYDITPALAQVFLERISSSGFDMRNTSTIHR